MKRIAIITGLFLLGHTGFCQVKKELKPAENVTAASVSKEDKKDRYKDLNLTQEQNNKIKDINKKFKEEKAKIEADATLAADAKAAKLKDLKKQHSKDFKSVLTPEQMEKYKASRAKSGDTE